MTSRASRAIPQTYQIPLNSSITSIVSPDFSIVSPDFCVPRFLIVSPDFDPDFDRLDRPSERFHCEPAAGQHGSAIEPGRRERCRRCGHNGDNGGGSECAGNAGSRGRANGGERGGNADDGDNGECSDRGVPAGIADDPSNGDNSERADNGGGECGNNGECASRGQCGTVRGLRQLPSPAANSSILAAPSNMDSGVSPAAAASAPLATAASATTGPLANTAAVDAAMASFSAGGPATDASIVADSVVDGAGSVFVSHRLQAWEEGALDEAALGLLAYLWQRRAG